MEAVLGLFGLVLYAACIVSLAAGITWLVVKVSPAEKKPKTPEPAEPAA